MADRMTLQQIERAYANEWVVVGEYTADDSVMVRDGIVLAHTPDIDEAHRLAGECSGDVAIWFVGKALADGLVGFVGIYK
jgi:hypothetical protein